MPALLREFGVDPAEVFASSGVNPDHVTPDTRVAFTDLLPLLQRAAIAADCPHLGLVLGLRFEMVKHHGLIGQLMDTAPTVRQALIDCVTWQLGLLPEARSSRPKPRQKGWLKPFKKSLRRYEAPARATPSRGSHAGRPKWPTFAPPRGRFLRRR